MRDQTIVLHDLVGKELRVAPDHIGVRRDVRPELGDNPKAKTVLEIDGVMHSVLETEEEIERLIENL